MLPLNCFSSRHTIYDNSGFPFRKFSIQRCSYPSIFLSVTYILVTKSSFFLYPLLALHHSPIRFTSNPLYNLTRHFHLHHLLLMLLSNLKIYYNHFSIMFLPRSDRSSPLGLYTTT